MAEVFFNKQSDHVLDLTPISFRKCTYLAFKLSDIKYFLKDLNSHKN